MVRGAFEATHAKRTKIQVKRYIFCASRPHKKYNIDKMNHVVIFALFLASIWYTLYSNQKIVKSLQTLKDQTNPPIRWGYSEPYETYRSLSEKDLLLDKYPLTTGPNNTPTRRAIIFPNKNSSYSITDPIITDTLLGNLYIILLPYVETMNIGDYFEVDVDQAFPPCQFYVTSSVAVAELDNNNKVLLNPLSDFNRGNYVLQKSKVSTQGSNAYQSDTTKLGLQTKGRFEVIWEPVKDSFFGGKKVWRAFGNHSIYNQASGSNGYCSLP